MTQPELRVSSVDQLLSLGSVAPLTIVTVEEIPELSTIHGKSRWSNRFLAIDQTTADIDGITVLRASTGQVWVRIRDVP